MMTDIHNINIIQVKNEAMRVIGWAMVLSITLNNILFTLWRSLEYNEKTTNLQQKNDKRYHIMLHRVHLARTGFEYTMLLVIGNACIGSSKSNCHTIMITAASRYNIYIRQP